MLNYKIEQSLKLSGKKAIITGASRGIGAAMAKAFARAGVNLVLISRTEENLKELVHEIQLIYSQEAPLNKREKTDGYANKVLYYAVDLTDENTVKKTFADISSFGGIDILINNAGKMIPKPLAFVKSEDIQSQFEINTFAVIRCCQYVSRLMIRNGGGSIINIASMLGEYGQQGQSIYAASKAAVSGLTRSLAQELANYQIRVNAIAPGVINTSLLSVLTDKEKEQIRTRIALQRFGQPEEVANTCLFLASDWSSYITGQVIDVDGGVHF